MRASSSITVTWSTSRPSRTAMNRPHSGLLQSGMNETRSAATNESLDGYLRTAIRAAREAARIQLAEKDSDLEIEVKSSDIDLVTRVDALCEESIRRIIGEAHPDHVVMGEELGQSASGSKRWIVDPLDGTVNYAHGFPCYCVSI